VSDAQLEAQACAYWRWKLYHRYGQGGEEPHTVWVAYRICQSEAVAQLGWTASSPSQHGLTASRHSASVVNFARQHDNPRLKSSRGMVADAGRPLDDAHHHMFMELFKASSAPHLCGPP
jgi:hypothetical protein